MVRRFTPEEMSHFGQFVTALQALSHFLPGVPGPSTPQRVSRPSPSRPTASPSPAPTTPVNLQSPTEAMLAADETTEVTWGVHNGKVFKELPAAYLHWILTHITASSSAGCQNLYFWANRHFEVVGAFLLRRTDDVILYPDARYGQIHARGRVQAPVTPLRPVLAAGADVTIADGDSERLEQALRILNEDRVQGAIRFIAQWMQHQDQP